MPWYRSEDYDRLRSVMIDGAKMPEAYRIWLMSAEQVEATVSGAGVDVSRIVIEPDAFLSWCEARGLKPDGAARARFANEAVLVD